MTTPIGNPEEFLQHWLGHRNLTRRVIEAFPEDQLFTFRPTEKLRPFGEMGGEILLMTDMQLNGLLSDAWKAPDWASAPKSKAALLNAWDKQTERLKTELPKVDSAVYARYPEHPWGKRSAWDFTVYQLDNEIHHRGQGMVYLRILDIQPPAFYER